MGCEAIECYPIQGHWESVLPKFSQFDAIYFNEYPLKEGLALINYLFPDDLLKTSEQAQEILGDLEQEMSQSKRQFSDKEIEDFYQAIGKFRSEELSKFFETLKENGNISKDQYDNALKKYKVQSVLQAKSKVNNMLFFLLDCLNHHMKKDGRFSCFLNLQTSKYQDSQFYESIINNPFVDYHETKINLKLSDKTREALIILITKQA